MMKRFSAVAVAVLLAVTSSFASWDYFPPQEAGRGEVKLGFTYDIPFEKMSIMSLSLGARYSIIDGLEASVILPLPMSASYDGNSADGFFGLVDPIIGVRYWLPMGLGFFLDFTVAVDTRDEDEGYEAGHSFIGLGAQYSMNFTEELSFGSEIGLTLGLPKDDFTPGMDMNIGVELQYALGAVTPFLGFDVVFGVTDESFDGDSIDDSASEMGMDLTLGVTYDINEKMGIDAFFGLGFGDRYGDDNTPMTIGAAFSFKF